MIETQVYLKAKKLSKDSKYLFDVFRKDLIYSVIKIFGENIIKRNIFDFYIFMGSRQRNNYACCIMNYII